MKRSKLALILIIFVSVISSIFWFKKTPSTNIKSHKVHNFSLLDEEGKHHFLHRKVHKKYILLMATDSQSSSKSADDGLIRQLWNQFNESFYFLNIDSSREKFVQSSQKQDFPTLLDFTKLVSQSLGFQQYGEAIILDTSSMRIIWRGFVNKSLKHYMAAVDRGKKWTLNSVEPDPNRRFINYIKPEYISYKDDIVPILKENCLHCHRQNGAAPWAMTSYEAIQSWSGMIGEVVREKRMPPRIVDPIGRELENKSYYGLSIKDELALMTWIARGAPNDTVDADPLRVAHKSIVEKMSGWPLGPPDAIAELKPSVKIPARGWLDWQIRNAKLKDKTTSPQWIKAIYFKQDHPQVIHHSSVWSITESPHKIASISYVLKSKWLESPLVKNWIAKGEFFLQSDLGLLYQGKANLKELNKTGDFLGPNNTSLNLMTIYSPGVEYLPQPQDAGYHWNENTMFRVVSHYKTIGTELTDRPKLGIYFHKNSKDIKTLKIRAIQNNGIFIPAQTRDYTNKIYFMVEKDMTLYGVGPHLHYRGVAQNIEVHFPDGSSQLLISLTNFQYTFLTHYFFKEPLKIPAGSFITSQGWFDNSKSNPFNPNPNRDGIYGQQQYDEMFWAALIFTET